MIATDSHSAPSSDTFKPQKLVSTLSPQVILVFICHRKLVKHSIQYFLSLQS